MRPYYTNTIIHSADTQRPNSELRVALLAWTTYLLEEMIYTIGVFANMPNFIEISQNFHRLYPDVICM